MDIQEYCEDDDLDYGDDDFQTTSLHQVILGYHTYLLIQLPSDSENADVRFGGNTGDLEVILKKLPKIRKAIKKDLKQ